jgi:hypothetical protein
MSKGYLWGLRPKMQDEFRDDQHRDHDAKDYPRHPEGPGQDGDDPATRHHTVAYADSNDPLPVIRTAKFCDRIAVPAEGRFQWPKPLFSCAMFADGLLSRR